MSSTRKDILDLLYKVTDEEFRTLDSTFYSWDKGDCSEAGALLVILKYVIGKEVEKPYYLDSYPQHKEIYELLFSNPTKYIG
jgi:hypothetical protein